MRLKSSGRIRGIGAANVSSAQVREYLAHGDLDIVQMRYSILDRTVEEDLLPTCLENGIVVQAYSPLEMGILAGAVPRGWPQMGEGPGRLRAWKKARNWAATG